MRFFAFAAFLAVAAVDFPLHAATPAVFWASDPVRPGEVVVVQGGNFGKEPKVELQRPDAATGETQTIAPLQATDESLKFLVPGDWKQGVFRFRVVSGSEKSEAVALNLPDPWWQQGDAGREASPGGWLRIFGKCLSFDNHATVLLRNGDKDVALKPVQQESWSLAVDLPKDLAEGNYQVYVHNGFEDQSGWKKAETVHVAAHAPAWKSDLFDAVKYGAVANDGMDDTVAVQKAIDAAAANGGGIVTLPRGRFQMNEPLRIPPHVLLQGDGKNRTQLYWRDTPEPFEALIYGTNSFGIEDLTIMAANHRFGILADPGTKPDAGNVTLRRLHIDLNRFVQLQIAQAAGRIFPYAEEQAVSVGGDNVQVTDCEIFSSRSPFNFAGVRNSVIRNNHCFEGGTAHYIGGDRIIFEGNVVEGGMMARGGGDYCNHVYYARNTIGMMPLADGEGFTTDGGGNAPVKLVACEGVHLTLDGNVDWNRWSRQGHAAPYICIIEGTGAGQSRKIVSYKGRDAEMEQPWTIAPDATSKINLIPDHFRRHLIVDNRFHDFAVFQSYAWAFDWVFCGNHFSRVGGIRTFTHPGDPAWFMQYFENEIDVGNCYRGIGNNQPPTDASLAIVSGQARCQVLRRNTLHNNARISINGSAKDVLVEHNTIRDADVGVDAGQSQRTLLWGNRFERVTRPVVNLPGKTSMHPADRVLAELSSIAESLPKDSEPILTRLKKLAAKDPQTPGLIDEVQKNVLDLVKLLAAAPNQDYPSDVARALWNVNFSPMFGDKNRPLLESVGGHGDVWFGAAPSVCAIPAKLSLEFPTEPACQAKDLKNFELKPGVDRGTSIPIDVKPGVVGMFTVPVRWTVQGDGWKLAGHGRMRIGNEWCGQITQWAFCGPFFNPTHNVFDENLVDAPERRLDLSEKYDTLAGRQGWTTINARKIDFAEKFGPQKSAVAFAVAVLRAKKPTPVQFDFNVQGNNNMEPSLNGLPWRVPNHYGKSFSRTLRQGDNVLMVKLVNVDKNWTLEARMHMVDWASPGDVEVVPIEKFDSVAALHPTPRPATPEGRSIPFADGVDWRLAYEDDFNRARLGSDWDYGPGSWAEHKFLFGNGVITPTNEMHSFLTYMHKVSTPLRIEYDVKGCSSAVLLTRSNEVGIFCGIDSRPVGYVIQCGCGGCTIMREAKDAAHAKVGSGISADKWSHVVVQFAKPKISVFVNGKPNVEFTDPDWLVGRDTFSFQGNAWGPLEIDNVRIYEAEPKATK